VGVHQALHERGVEPAQVDGFSAGTINGVVMVFNPPAVRIAVLTDAWHPLATEMS